MTTSKNALLPDVRALGTAPTVTAAGPSSRGATVAQRTVITIDSPDRHVIDIYFTPPGGEYLRRSEEI